MTEERVRFVDNPLLQAMEKLNQAREQRALADQSQLLALSEVDKKRYDMWWQFIATQRNTYLPFCAQLWADNQKMKDNCLSLQQGTNRKCSRLEQLNRENAYLAASNKSKSEQNHQDDEHNHLIGSIGREVIKGIWNATSK